MEMNINIYIPSPQNKAKIDKNMNKKCIVCGKEFEAKRADAKTCSDACRQKLNRVTDNLVTDNVTDKTPTVRYCRRCGKELEKEIYGDLIDKVYVCHSCCKTGGKPIEGKFKAENGLVFCSEHQEHTLDYCEKTCTPECHHILDDDFMLSQFN